MLIFAPALKTIVYNNKAGKIIYVVDASFLGWGGVFMQIFEGRRHPTRYKSGI